MVRGQRPTDNLSLLDAVITKAYAPILIIGCIGGTIIGWLSDKWAL